MIGVIADDITGAAELGALGLRYGLRAELLLEGAVPAADLVCVDADSRSCDPKEAGRRAAFAAEQLRAAGAEWIYNKVDSVLRGHIVAASEAIRRVTGASRTLLVPANPGLGRIIRAGDYFVRGTPLDQTDFRLDPEYPRFTSKVTALLGRGDLCQSRAQRRDEPLPENGIAVAEAETSDDVRRWAALLDGRTLAAGAAEFFGAVLGARGYTLQHLAGNAHSAGGPELFVCGSLSESTKGFLAESVRSGVPVLGLTPELACSERALPSEEEQLALRAAEMLAANRRVVLALDLPPMDRSLGPRMARRLAQVAVRAIEKTPATRIFAEGGATAASLARMAGWSRLRVLREHAQGVVTTVASSGAGCQFTLKPGSYTWPAEIVNTR